MSFWDVYLRSDEEEVPVRFTQKLKLSTLISESNPHTLKYVDNLTEIRTLRRKQIESGTKLIHCFSMFSFYFEACMGYIFAACLVLFPLEVAFAGHGLNYVSPFSVSLHVCCVCDIVRRFFTGYVDDKNSKIVMDPGKIARHYVFSVYFTTDLLSSVPNPQMFSSEENAMLRILSLLNLLKFFRLVTAYKYVTATSKYYKWNYGPCIMVGKLFFAFVICHWVACFVYLVPQLRHALTGHYSHRSWVTLYNLTEKSTEQQYLASFFHSTAIILGVKLIEVERLGLEEKVLACFLYVGGKIFFSLITVVLIGYFLRYWSLESTYFGIIEQLRGYILRKCLSNSIRARLLNYYNYKFHGTYFEERKIRELLSDRLRQEINTHVLSKFTENVDLFVDCSPETITRIINNLQAEVFLPKDIIIKAGTVADCMYFLAAGTVAVLTPSGKEVCHLHDGDYFGEISLVLQGTRRTAHVIALEVCEVFRLSKKGLEASLKRDEELMKQLTEEAMRRMEMTQVYEDVYLRGTHVNRRKSDFNIKQDN